MTKLCVANCIVPLRVVVRTDPLTRRGSDGVVTCKPQNQMRNLLSNVICDGFDE